VWSRKRDRESGLFPRIAARWRSALISSTTRLQSWRCPAQTIIPIIAPSGPQAAVIIDHAHMSQLAPCAQLLCGIGAAAPPGRIQPSIVRSWHSRHRTGCFSKSSRSGSAMRPGKPTGGARRAASCAFRAVARAEKGASAPGSKGLKLRWIFAGVPTVQSPVADWAARR
jgi:hypothetical protein